MTKHLTLLFPGQGSQYVGMGKNLQGVDEKAYSLFYTADEILKYSLSQICWEGPEEKLKLTQNTQPAIVTHSVALLTVLKNKLQGKDYKIERVLGHSVGEYAALVAAGSLRFEQAVMAVHLRGKYMQEAVAPGKGKMFAILRAKVEDVIKACEVASRPGTEEIVTPANFNDPGQIVISGETGAALRAVKWLETQVKERVRAVELPVSAPFHCPLMEPAAQKLAEHFKNLTFQAPQIPYVANIDAKEYPLGTDPEKVKQNLIRQVAGSVLWTQSILTLPPQTLCVEVGPGKVLKGLVKKINPELQVISLDSEESFKELEDCF